MSADRSAAGRARIERAQEAMAAEGFDALLLVSGTNLIHLSGYPQVELTLARPFFLVLPRRGPPVLLVHEARRIEARRFSWVADVRTYHRLSVAPVAELDAILRQRGLTGGRIGAELGYEQRLGMPVAEFLRLQSELAPTRFEDAALLLWRLRSVKSPDEIGAIRRACRITATAFRETFAQPWIGRTEQDLRRDMLLRMSRLGGASPWVAVTSGAGNYDLALGSGTMRTLEPGDLAWMDAGCQVDGRWSDFSRAGVIGGPSPEQAEAQRLIGAITREGVEMIRPGRSVAEIAQHCRERIGALGLELTSDIGGLAGRVGHGLGLDVTEPPHVSEDDPTVLEPGMVLTVEPGFATAYGTFHVEENVACTLDGHALLSRAPRELAVMPLDTPPRT